MTDSRVRLQWKGTDACFDFYCSCGSTEHFDGEYLYAVQCSYCGKIWALSPWIRLIEMERPPEDWNEEDLAKVEEAKS